MSKIKQLLKRLLTRNSAKILPTTSTTLNLYKIHTLKGDTYWIPQDEATRALGPTIRQSYQGAILNPDIKVATILPWHQIDWLQEAGSVTV